ncbi:hypothetical protein LCGC14_2332990, partial [marine sediment metagenome]
MPTYQYQAMTSAGRLMTGTLVASSADEVAQLLQAMELTVSSIDKSAPQPARSRISRSEFLLFNQQLGAIAAAGIPLERSLRELSADVSSPRMRRLIGEIATDLEAGQSVEQAFDARSRHFPPLYGRILAAGVRTGRLSEMLTSLNRHLEISGQTKRIIVDAVAYPAVVLALALAIMTVLLAFLVPQFKP